MSEEAVLCHIDGPVAHLRLNRPAALNALNQAMAEGLFRAVNAVSGDASVRALLLSGAGRGFMAEGDVRAFHAAGDNVTEIVAPLIDRLHATLRALTALPIPVIAAVHGPVAGAGLSLMLAADIILAADDSRFVLAYPRIGTSPDGGSTWALPRVIGLRRALGLALMDEELDAPAALAVGLVNRVVPANELMTAADALATRLAAGPTAAFGRTKALLRASLDRDFGAQLDAEREAFLASTATTGFREGVAAFVEKRVASFGERGRQTGRR